MASTAPRSKWTLWAAMRIPEKARSTPIPWRRESFSSPQRVAKRATKRGWVYTRLEAKAGFWEACTAKFTRVTKHIPLRSAPRIAFGLPRGFRVSTRKTPVPVMKRKKEST